MRRCTNLIPMALACSLMLVGAIAPAAARADTVVGANAVVGADPDRSEPMDPETRGLAAVADILFARPLGLVATLAGCGLFAIALPFEAMSGDVQEPARLLVVEPARYTFTRPLGQIDSLR